MTLKLFAKDAAIYALGNIGLRAAALLLTPVYTYCLSLSDYGLWATLQITIQLMTIVMSLGMRETAVRFTKECEESDRIKQLIGTSTLVVLAGGMLVTGASLVFLAPVFRVILHREEVRELVLLACGGALAQSLCIQVMSYYRANNQSGRYIACGLGGALLLLLTTFPALWMLHLGVRGVLWAYMLSYLAVYIIVSADIFRKTGIGWSAAMASELLRFGAPLVFSSSGQFVMGGASIYLLSYFVGLEVVAVFSLGLKLTGLLSIGVLLPFQLAFQPFIYSNLNDPRLKSQAGRLFTYMLLATTCAAFVLIVGSRVLLPFIAPPAYSGALLVIICLLPGQAFMGVHYFGETLIAAVKRTQILAVLNTLCAALCIGLSLAFIPLLSWYGAALAANITAILIDSIEVSIGLRQFGLSKEIEWRRIAAIGVLFTAQLAAAFVLRNQPGPAFFGGAAAFLVFGLVFLSLGPFGKELSAVTSRWTIHGCGCSVAAEE